MARASRAPSRARRRAHLFAWVVVSASALAEIALGCITITPTACHTDAQCAADSTCQRGVCVYRQGYGEGGGGGAAPDAGTPDADADAADGR